MNLTGVIVCDGAIVVPPLSLDLVNQTGVLWNGDVVRQSITRRGAQPAHAPPPRSTDATAELKGTWMWAGQLYQHFGHFLTESATRLWAYEYLRENIAGIIYTPKRFAGDVDLALWQQDFLRAAGVDVQTQIVRTPTMVDRLVIPEQGFGLGRLALATPEYRTFIRERFAAGIAPDGPERLYLSRSRFGHRKGGLLAESEVEAHLATEGYEIFHPEEHPIPVQIARMKAARRVLGPDGSAFHLAGLVARPDLKAAVIMRRNTAVSQNLIRQFSSLRGVRLNAVNAIRNDWTSEGKKPDSSSYAELGFADLSQQLQALEMIDGRGWPDPNKETIRKYIQQIARARGSKLIPLQVTQKVTFKDQT